MAQSSPEGIILGPGSKLVSLDLFVNEEKVLSIKQEERYTEEEVFNILEGLKDIPRSQFKEEFLKKFKK
jgi:lipoate-protein ligase A